MATWSEEPPWGKTVHESLPSSPSPCGGLGTVGGTTTCYMGDWYEWTSSAGDKYYTLGGRRVAMRTSSGNVNYLHGDHLATTMNTTGSQTSGPQRSFHLTSPSNP